MVACRPSPTAPAKADWSSKWLTRRQAFPQARTADPAPKGIKISVENNNTVKIEGADKEKVGQVAAELRAVRPPEPYKGKGVRYQGEQVRRKAGKTGAK